MYIAQRTFRLVNGLMKSYGPSEIKRALWDTEYSGDKWNFNDNTVGDCVYSHLERHLANGSILDLGCGSGNTSTELPTTAYQKYIGVDISEAALRKAMRRSENNGRRLRNRFVQADIVNYVPPQQFDVILFRESLYHIPLGKVKATLERYAKYLTCKGVFIVRMNTTDGSVGKSKPRPTAMVAIIENAFDVLEKCQYEGPSGPTVIVFRAK